VASVQVIYEAAAGIIDLKTSLEGVDKKGLQASVSRICKAFRNVCCLVFLFIVFPRNIRFDSKFQF
jgi:hypothetical protein